MYTQCVDSSTCNWHSPAYLLLGGRGPEDSEGGLVALVAPLEHSDQVGVEVVAHLLVVHLGKEGWTALYMVSRTNGDSGQSNYSGAPLNGHP